MTSTATIIDAALLALAAVLFILNYRGYRARKRLVGTVRAEWSLRFHLAFPWEWARLAALVVCLASAITVAVTRSPAEDPFGPAVILALVLAFFPRNNFVVIGSAGVLDRWIFIPWERITNKRVVETGGRRYLELEITPEDGDSREVRTKRLRVPRDVSLVLD